MNTSQIHRGESLRNAQHFLDVHADVVGEVNSTKARKQLDTAITTLDAVTTVQGTKAREVRAVVVGRKQLETELTGGFMTPLSKFARAELQGVPDFAALTPSANQLRTVKLVQSARDMAKAAEPLAAQITAEFGPNFLTGLSSAAEAVRTALNTRSQKSLAKTGATKGVADALASGRSAVASLDARVSRLIRGNGQLEREWLAAKRVRKAAVVAAAVPVPVPVPVPTPVPVITTAPVTVATPATTTTPVATSVAATHAPAAQEVPTTKVA